MAEQLNLNTDYNSTDFNSTDRNATTSIAAEPRRAWQLDERTREVGRRGIASARAALAAHRPTDDHHRQAA